MNKLSYLFYTLIALKSLMLRCFRYSINIPKTIRYILTLPSKITMHATSFSINLDIIKTVITINPIPEKTATIEDILCFTTSVSFSAFIFGYFKLIIIPRIADIAGKIIDDIRSRSISINDNLNLMNRMILPNNIHGTMMAKALKTLEQIILNGVIGKLFNMLKVFPSSEIIELVIDVINDVAHIKINAITGR